MKTTLQKSLEDSDRVMEAQRLQILKLEGHKRNLEAKAIELINQNNMYDGILERCSEKEIDLENALSYQKTFKNLVIILAILLIISFGIFFL